MTSDKITGIGFRRHARAARAPMLELTVLAIAEREPVSGKLFSDKVAALTQGFWRVSPGLVYPLLRRMEREGLLKCEIAAGGGRGRRELAYAPTAKGKTFLEKARKIGKEHFNKMMARVVPLSALVCFGDCDEEFLEAVTKTRFAFNEKIWRTASHGKTKRLKELRKLADAIEKA